MSFPARTSSLQAYHMLLYRNGVHPEFFNIEGRKRIEHMNYEFEIWNFNGGHVCMFDFEGVCLVEVVTPELEHLPERGLVSTTPCAGEKDHQSTFGERISFMTSIQTETLTDHLYLGTYEELLEHGRSEDCLMSHWQGLDGQQNLSLVELQRYSDQVHVQGYHLQSDCSMVLRTQSIFQAGINEDEESIDSSDD
jgi:hypothetical protein